MFISQGMLEPYNENGHQLPNSRVAVLWKQLVKIDPWLAENFINKASLRHKRESLSPMKETTVTTTTHKLTHQSTRKSDTGTAISSSAELPVINDRQVPESITIGCDSVNTKVATLREIIQGGKVIRETNWINNNKCSTKRERLSLPRTSAHDNLHLFKTKRQKKPLEKE